MSLKMDYNYLGDTGMKVSNLCFGALTFGIVDDSVARPGQLNEADSHLLLDRYVEWGGNFIDTADVYADGLSEKIVGSWLSKHNRNEFVVATKVRFNTNPKDVNSIGLSRKHIMAGIESSLKNLQTSYIDIYQTHCWDVGTPIKETLLTLHDLQRAGKIHYVGLSNVCGWQIQKIVDVAKDIGMLPIASLQQQYSLLERHSEFEEFQVCLNEGIGVLPWSPLKGGFLSGKFKRDEMPSPETRIGFTALEEQKRVLQSQPAWTILKEKDAAWELLDIMKDIATVHGKSVAQVALRWLIQKKIVSSVIFGAKTLQQLDDNLGASSGWELTEEEMQKLDEISKPKAEYPHVMISKVNVVRQK
ncbi:unnamed protein product [Acanthosepion pharaonis]|uniref:NADP-dependent oxidoreductase domain-containing protein n=1 Tax=Acanthosepion pharaonis TaxID=158019 RepID=A0A812BIK0_ACAPH|nr:unnamed protein product [Sepia pharaonis]